MTSPPASVGNARRYFPGSPSATVSPEASSPRLTSSVTTSVHSVVPRMLHDCPLFTAPTPIEPERIYEYTIDLWATAITFLPGHRLRVEITSSSFPRWDRNLNTGDDSATTTAMAVAHQRIVHDAAHPSSLIVWQVTTA